MIAEIFNSREIAMGSLALSFFVLILFYKPTRIGVKNIVAILLGNKFLILGFFSCGYLCAVLYLLCQIGYWDFGLLKDTIFWVLFFEFPTFAKAVLEAKNGHFFYKLIQDSIKLTVVIEFVVGFWTFGLKIEFLMIIFIVVISILYAVSLRKKEYLHAKNFFELLLVIFVIVILGVDIFNIVEHYEQFFQKDTLKSFLLPAILLFVNLPMIYGIAIYNIYEQIFINLKGDESEKRKMRFLLLRFIGLNINKATAVRYTSRIMTHCCDSDELKVNLIDVEKRLKLQIGDNYMKKPYWYVFFSTILLFVSSIGLLSTSLDLSVKELFGLDFTLSSFEINGIFAYIFLILVSVNLTLLIIAICICRNRNEEISQIKKYALYELLLLVKIQKRMLLDYPPVDDAKLLFSHYVHSIYELKPVCDKVLAEYENLLTSWERDTINKLQLSCFGFVGDLGIQVEDINKYDVSKFAEYYEEQVRHAPQSEKINIYVYALEKDIEKYSKNINLFSEEFKNYY